VEVRVDFIRVGSILVSMLNLRVWSGIFYGWERVVSGKVEL
jgi:hypothetical protein